VSANPPGVLIGDAEKVLLWPERIASPRGAGERLKIPDFDSAAQKGDQPRARTGLGITPQGASTVWVP